MNGMRRRVTRRSVAAWSSALGSLTEALHLAVTEAGDEGVVHHPHSLHEGVTDGRPDKAEATLDERRAHRVRLTRPGGEIPQRSEEHTSELQSQSNLVCRLLLEKKKTQKSETCWNRSSDGNI